MMELLQIEVSLRPEHREIIRRALAEFMKATRDCRVDCAVAWPYLFERLQQQEKKNDNTKDA